MKGTINVLLTAQLMRGKYSVTTTCLLPNPNQKYFGGNDFTSLPVNAYREVRFDQYQVICIRNNKVKQMNNKKGVLLEAKPADFIIYEDDNGKETYCISVNLGSTEKEFYRNFYLSEANVEYLQSFDSGIVFTRAEKPVTDTDFEEAKDTLDNE